MKLLGALLVTTVALAAMSRADMPEEKRRPFFLAIDEFQNCTTRATIAMVAELRKYKVGLTLAHQHGEQLTSELRQSVVANAGTRIAFRVGPLDAALLAREWDNDFTPSDLMSLPNHHILLSLMIDGAPSRPFSAVTLRAPQLPAFP